MAASTDATVQRYLALSKALAADDFDAATAALSPLRTAADETAHAADADVAAAAAHVREALPKDPKAIADVRSAFKQISVAVTALARLAPPTAAVGPLLRQAFCPMADASWLQVESEIQNPYMGQRMPHCGRVTGTIETRAVKEEK